MKQGLSLVAVGHATSLFLAITFVLCVGFDLLFPVPAMFQALAETASGIPLAQRGQFLPWSDRKLCLRLVHRAHLGAAL